ncbi:peptidase U32 family protein [Salsuginibacillus kocurii]|uniref:peptidase U32 family protein n=1 Tax=Salsuginibacillus kocurii TaxID=427078 RepID=UPI0003785095|nr:peptidase U32 family protein [Salsuginibacillus kocurii]
MTYLPELLVTPTAVEDIAPLYEAGADAVLVGEQTYGLRLAGDFDRAQLEEVVNIGKNYAKKVYVKVNALFHNDYIDQLYDYLCYLNELNVDAIVFGDPAVLVAAREVAPGLKLHWNPETTATNWYTANYWGRKGAERAVLSREINFDAITEIADHAEVETEVQVHGATCMFQSKRKLVGNYMAFQGKQLEVEKTDQSRNLFLHDPERNAAYPIFEDANGTHIISAKDICIIDELDELLDAEVSSMKIEGLLKSSQYVIEATKLYHEAIHLYLNDPARYNEKREELLNKAKTLQPEARDIDTGFFFKETVY